MSAVDEIETAIARLTDLRASTVSMPWEVDGSLIRSDGWILAEVKLTGDEQTSELIITLHRTIDAQLAILRAALGHFPVYALRPDEEEAYVEKRPSLRLGLELARAINGTTP